MSDLLAARLQMAFSLGFHIVFAAIGIGMPLLMVIAEYRWLRARDPIIRNTARDLARHWAKGTAIFFAVGAVSGTVLSFELGLLWPRFMAAAGGIIGFPFSLEGFAFFTEAIFLGIYLYAWDRIHPWAHWAAGITVALSGAASALFVVMANAWMNAPTGFTFDPATGQFSDIDPIAAMFNPAWNAQAAHMIIAAYMATAFAAAGIHALQLLRCPDNPFHRQALAIAMTVAAIAAILQPLSGDWAAKVVARTQPVKLAAMEGQFRTEPGAPLRIGGWPDESTMQTPYAIEVPRMLSFLAYGDTSATVRGLEAFPRDQWPPVAPVHFSFQVMIACGSAMLAVALWFLASCWRPRTGRRLPTSRPLLLAIVACLPLGFVAIETGWMVTEIGRQPWIIYGVMRTSDAVTPMPGLVVPFITFSLVYLGLGAIVAVVFARWSAPARRRSTPIPPLEHITAWAMLAALIAYTLLAGADFGAGLWDLLASGPRRIAQREAIAHAIGPIWEANHVWLILVVVLLFTGFPSAFAALTTALHIPLTLVLLGIVLRGSAFVFRSYGAGGDHETRRWGLAFAIASLITPLLLGVTLGTAASGDLHWDDSGTYTSGFFAPWLRPFPWSVGLFALAIFAFLAAVYLCAEQPDGPLREDFRRRALASAAAVGLTAGLTWILAYRGAPLLSHALGAHWWAWPLQLATGAAAVGAIGSLFTRRFILARALAVAQVTLIMLGYGAALFPYLVVPQFTITNSAAPPQTHRLVLTALAIGAAILLPSLVYLLRIFKGRRAFAIIDG